MTAPATTTRFQELQRQTNAFHKKAPMVWELFVRYADEARSAGRKVGAKAVWERIRWEGTVHLRAKWRMNNNFIALYARRYNNRVGQQFFDERKQTSKTKAPKAGVYERPRREEWFQR